MSDKKSVGTDWLADRFAEEMVKLDTGRTTPQSSRALVALGNGILQVKRLEMDFSRFVSTQRADSDNEEFSLKPVILANVTQ